jgi:hypothetical protein
MRESYRLSKNVLDQTIIEKTYSVDLVFMYVGSPELLYGRESFDLIKSSVGVLVSRIAAQTET